MTQSYCLPPHVDSVAAPAVAAALLELRGGAVEVDASETTFIGALGFQVLVSARAQWRADEQSFAIAKTTQSFADAATSLGLELDSLSAVPPTPSTEAEGEPA